MTNERQHVRRETSDYYLVYNRHNNQLLGRVRNLTVAGAMLISSEPAVQDNIYQCRMDLPEEIDGLSEVHFDAEVRWCRENEKAGWYECGLRFAGLDAKHARVIQKMLQNWMKHGSAPAKNKPKRSKVEHLH